MKIEVSIISTWDIRCGIAEYSKLLSKELESLEPVNISICPIKKPNSTNLFYFLKLMSQVKNPHIIHIQYQGSIFGHLPIPHFSYSYFPLLILAIRLLKKSKIIATIHDFRFDSKQDILKLKFLDLSDKLIVHTKKLAEMLISGGISDKKIAIIPIGTPKGEILDKEECKRRLGVEGKRILTIFGFVHENKGHDLLINVLPKLGQDVVLLIAGAPRLKEHESYYNSLKEAASSLGVKDRVKFLGFIKAENLPIIFNATDIAIYPYREIAASAALHFALGYQIPVIASDLDYFKEIKEEYECVELFEKDNENDLYRKIRELLLDKIKRYYLKKKSGEFYEKTNWRRVAEKHKELYLNLLAESRM